MEGPGPQPIAIEGIESAATFYDSIGGHDTFERLVSGFYARVASDPVLAALYPDHDWAGAAERLMLFLEQYWGGPRTYSQTRGHPRLRARHAEFRIDIEARDRWLAHMRSALDDLGLPAEADETLWAYLTMSADVLVNS
ncbi:MAG TPA: globin [Mycobacteriales bacterium]|jgi:hemoglobin|nr:globin [Mycobacteriales bacterium]